MDSRDDRDRAENRWWKWVAIDCEGESGRGKCEEEIKDKRSENRARTSYESDVQSLRGIVG